MAKLSSIQKNLFRQKLIQIYKLKRKDLKSKIKNKNISLEERISFQNMILRNQLCVSFVNYVKINNLFHLFCY